jgi:hypothetical protein
MNQRRCFLLKKLREEQLEVSVHNPLQNVSIKMKLPPYPKVAK